MPTVMRIGPYRLYFYSADGDEPPTFMLNATTQSPSIGSTRSGSRRALDIAGLVCARLSAS